jgi:WWE domain
MYSYKPTGASWQPSFSDRPEGEADEREMFLTKLLVGNAVTVDQNNSLIVPPHDPANPGQRYNTVTGTTGGSPVYIVYENGRAYPSYLVRYYKGAPDRKRTPFETHDEAKDAMSPSSTSPSSVGSLSDDDDDDRDPALDLPAGDGSTGGGGAVNGSASAQVRAVWEFYDNHGWARYGDAHQADLEGAHRRGDTTFAFDTGHWSYEVNFRTMDQVNLDHPSHTRRKVRRLEVPVATPLTTAANRSASFAL